MIEESIVGKSCLVLPLLCLPVLLAHGTTGGSGREIYLQVVTADGGTPSARIEWSEPGRDASAGVLDEVEIPWSGTLEAPPGAPVQIAVTAAGYWAPALETSEDREDYVVILLPAGTVTGSLAVPEGELPERLPASVRAEPESDLEAEEIRLDAVNADIGCPLDGDRWRCTVPAGTVDLKISPEGFAPAYLWQLPVARGEETATGHRNLIRGASVAGWVEAATDPSAPGSVEVRIEPRAYGVSPVPEEKERNELLTQKVETSERGFFQIGGLTPGSYLLRAVGEGAVSESVELDVAKTGGEIFLDRPLVLAPLPTLRLFLDPPADPRGERWIVDLSRRVGRSNAYMTVKRGRALHSGAWEAEAIEAGSYALEVLDAEGSRWLIEELEVGVDPDPVFLQIPAVVVRGRLTAGDEGVAATIFFGGKHSVPSIRIDSDEEGSFEGILPREGEWRIELEREGGWGSQALDPVEVERSAGKSYAEVELELPDTVLRGRVVEEGRPAEAMVLGVREVRGEGGRPRREVTGRSRKDDGSFELRGVLPGPMQIHAYRGYLTSETTTVDVQEGVEGPELLLELEPKHEITGRVLLRGAPVPGARVLLFPDPGLSTEANTGPDGRFTARLPGRSRSVGLVVLPPGGAIVTLRLALDAADDGEVVLSVPAVGGDLVLTDPQRALAQVLRHAGVSLPLRSLFGVLSAAGRLEPHPDGFGLLIRGVEPGLWSLCGSQDRPGGCMNAIVQPATEALLGPIPEKGE
jgi:hypothetical protein